MGSLAPEWDQEVLQFPLSVPLTFNGLFSPSLSFFRNPIPSPLICVSAMTGVSGRAWGKKGDTSAPATAAKAACGFVTQNQLFAGPGPQRSIAPKRAFPLSQGLIKIIRILFGGWGKETSLEGPFVEARAGCDRPRYHHALNGHLTPCPLEIASLVSSK